MNSINADDAPIPANSRVALEGFVGSFRNPFHKFMVHTYKEQNKAIASILMLRGAAQGVLEQRMKAVQSGEDEHFDILTHILKLSEHFPGMDELIDHFLTFMVGGKS